MYRNQRNKGEQHSPYYPPEQPRPAVWRTTRPRLNEAEITRTGQPSQQGLAGVYYTYITYTVLAGRGAAGRRHNKAQHSFAHFYTSRRVEFSAVLAVFRILLQSDGSNGHLCKSQ